MDLNTRGTCFIPWLRKKISLAEMRQRLPECYPRLRRFCFVLTNSDDRAGDLAQATALKALEKHDLFARDENLCGWLFRIAQRTWLNEVRSQGVRSGTGTEPADNIVANDWRADPEASLYHSQILQAVTALPDGQRSAILLVYVEGFSYAEAAAICDVPIGTIMSRLVRARKALSKTIDDGTKRVAQ